MPDRRCDAPNDGVKRVALLPLPLLRLITARMRTTNMLSHTTLRHPRTLFAIGLLTLCLTLVLSYERIKSSTFSLLEELVPADEGGARIISASDQENKDYESIFDNLAPTSYGTTARPPLKGMPKMMIDALPDKYVPAVAGTKGSDGARRLVIIGDVHGQKKALADLLAKLEFDNNKGDHLILTGDLVNKGPDSAGVVEMAMNLGAHSVRGNHEDRVLLAHAAMNAVPSASDIDAATKAFEKFQVKEGEDGAQDPKAAMAAYQAGEAALSKGDRRDRETAQSLSPEQIKWLSRLPVILHVGPVPLGVADPTFENVVVCHAGLVPNVALESQDPWAVMNMRTLVYPVDELRRDAVRNYLQEKAKPAGGSNRGALAAEQSVDESKIDKELEKILKLQGLEDHAGETALPSSGREGTYWYEEWSHSQQTLRKKNKKKTKKDRERAKEEKSKKDKKGNDDEEGDSKRQPITTVVYGHDAKSGLRVPKEYGKGRKGYTFGLDSGCVYGRSLTALVIKMNEDKAVHEIVQVDCEKGVDGDD